MADGGLFYACITHVELPVAFPPYVTPIYVGQAQGPGRLNLRDLAPEWEPHHPVLGGTAGVFAVKALLQRARRDVTRVGLSQYRKFVSRERISRVVAKSYKSMDVVAAHTLTPERFAEAMRPGDEPFLVSRLASLHKEGGYVGQYCHQHHAQDLLRFAAEAVDQGILDSAEAHAFLEEGALITGGLELGVFPADFWIENIGAVENVVRACIGRDTTVRTGYQVRAWAFCAERLGSWLALRRLRAEGGGVPLLPSHWEKRFVGRLNIITTEGERNYVVGGP